MAATVPNDPEETEYDGDSLLDLFGTYCATPLFQLPFLPFDFLSTIDHLDPDTHLLLKQLEANSLSILYLTSLTVLHSKGTFPFNTWGIIIFTTPNLSASAMPSEALSAHFMSDLLSEYDIVKILTETQIPYIHNNSSKTDYVFVFRIPLESIIRLAIEVKTIIEADLATPIKIFSLLTKTNDSAYKSNNNSYRSLTSKEPGWDAQFLHVLTDTPKIINIVCDWLLQTTSEINFSRIVITVLEGHKDHMWMFDRSRKKPRLPLSLTLSSTSPPIAPPS